MKREDVRRENARRLATDAGGLTEFARKTGMENSQVSQIIGKNPTKNIGNLIASRIEQAFDQAEGSLDIPCQAQENAQQGSLGGENAVNAASFPGARPVSVEDENSPHHHQIPKVTLRLQAGVTGIETEPDLRDGGTLGISRTWIERKGFNPENLIAIQVRGESMEPTFYEDDTVVINLADKKPVDNGVYAINYEGEAVVKRLSRDAGQWWLMSDNSDQRKYFRRACQGNRCIIIGRVVRREGDNF
jgi:phage repressor protein C with HTH and peptisase S24 domain